MPRASSNRVRVLQVLEATAGGTRRHLRELVEFVAGPRVGMHIACATRRQPEFAEDLAWYEKLGIQTSILPMTTRPHPVLDPISVHALRKLIRHGNFDLIHLHSARAGWLGRLAAAHVPVIYSPHAFPFLRRDPLRWLYSGAERVLAPRADYLHAVSAAEGRLAIERGLFPAERVRVVENGVDLKRLEAAIGPRQPLAGTGATRTFAFVGSLRPQKDPFRFVEAARLCIDRGIAARFLLPAHGPLLAKVRRRVNDLGMASRFSFVPANESIVGLLREMDIAVLPSQWEGLPYTLLECAGLARPVITSDLPVFRDLLGGVEPRLLASGSDPASLAEVIRSWAAAPRKELEETGRRLRSLIARNHDLNAWRIRMLSLYLEVAGATQAATSAAAVRR